MKIYSSFKEIDVELEILKLESEIEKEKLKKSYFYFKESISPMNIATSMISNIAQKAFFGKLLQKILPFY
ncbi:MAG: hypothetical protein CVU03_09580 [Bacteroidetes bacterium HGW-Bacteroidetes-2]|jgi:hypothetical protein|nr:MAG: hypothetical protein CVU03_09580 [Bacteroidetes bacterium HGW-Bacteroidetes-2]